MVFSDQIEMRIKVKQEHNTMHATQILHQTLQRSCPHIHACRLTALLDVVSGLVAGQTLTVTGLGRHTPRAISMKQGIKHSDRLIGNPHLATERTAIYQAVAHWLMGDQQRPIILVDWSDYTYDRSHLILRAAVPVGGRALTLYEEVHPYRCYGKASIHHRFLQALQPILPATCTPIIVTDAGFIGPWFKAVLKLGWHFIGRLPKSVLYREPSRDAWLKCRDLFDQATAVPRSVGAVALIRSHPLPCYLYHYRHPRRGRHKITKYGQQARSKHSKKNAQRETAPWILASSLGPDEVTAQQLMQQYRTRMQIEEGFRDLKNHRTGFALTDNRTRTPARLANLLLVGMLATLVVWLLGRLAEAKQWHYGYQANTVRKHRVLSLFYLGCLLVVQGQFQLTHGEFKQAIGFVQKDMLKQWG